MRVLSACALVLLAGCDASSDLGSVSFQTDAPAYRLGDAVTVRLTNGSSARVGYNLCFSTLQRSDGGRWLDVDRSTTEDPQVCQAILLGLEPGESAEGRLTVPDRAQAGEYRVQTSVEVGDDGAGRVVTNPFDVD